MSIAEAQSIGSSLPLASVVVVTRNRADSLARALTALRGLDYPNYEIIVVDNDSSDHTKKVIEESGARYIFSASSCGIGATRQKGVAAANGEIVAFCDDDCVPTREWLRHLARRLSRDPDLGLVAGQVINVGFPSRNGYANAKRHKGRSKLGRNGTLTFVENPGDAEFFGNMNLACRKEVIQAVGGYDAFFNVREEIDLQLRIRGLGYRIEFEPEAVLEHHYTGLHFKRRHVFYGPDLIRLYLCMKHFRPHSLKEWLSFCGYEARLLGRGLFRMLRKLAAAIFKLRLGLLPSIATETFNIVIARLALPWLYWRAKKEQRIISPIENN